jgi:hypothetical protein
MAGWYDRINNTAPQMTPNAMQMAQGTYGAPAFQNPIQKMNYIMQAMRNPAAFVRQHLPNIPDQIANNPDQILRYMQQNMGVTQQDIQRAASQIPHF